MADIKEGDEFRVHEVEEWKENNIVLTRFRPEHIYRVTDRNLKIVSDLLANGKAYVARSAAAAPKQASRAKSKGKIATKKGGK
jgi:hypothetical protein